MNVHESTGELRSLKRTLLDRVLMRQPTRPIYNVRIVLSSGTTLHTTCTSYVVRTNVDSGSLISYECTDFGGADIKYLRTADVSCILIEPE